MSSLIHWQVALGRERELRRIEASVDAHPFARFVALQFPLRSTPPKAAPEPLARPVTGTASASPCR
jgi:hypothetical protein